MSEKLNPIRNTAKSFRPIVKPIVKELASHSLSRKWLNNFYEQLTFNQMGIFQRSFNSIFENNQPFEPGCWAIKFDKKEILLPLTPENLKIDWDQALSILGHDVEVKQTYASLLNSSHPPEVFIDVGANYGLHSILFLTHGIKTITFEPNKLCHDYFQKLCVLNGVEPRIEGVAVGNSNNPVELWIPNGITAHGTINHQIKERMGDCPTLTTQLVEQKKIDDYLEEFGDSRILIKIDVEGNECEVLQGAMSTLQQKQPLVIFESWIQDDRRGVFDLLNLPNYGISSLPFTLARNQMPQFLSCSEFLKNTEHNFIAIPKS